MLFLFKLIGFLNICIKKKKKKSMEQKFSKRELRMLRVCAFNFVSIWNRIRQSLFSRVASVLYFFIRQTAGCTRARCVCCRTSTNSCYSICRVLWCRRWASHCCAGRRVSARCCGSAHHTSSTCPPSTKRRFKTFANCSVWRRRSSMRHCTTVMCSRWPLTNIESWFAFKSIHSLD